MKDSSWVIYNIQPSTFNVLSDLIGVFILTLFSLALARIYPYMVWDSVRRGRPMPVEGILGPPTIWESLVKFRWLALRHGNNDNGDGASGRLPSRWIIVALPLALLCANAAHSIADIFLDFINVRVGTGDTFFLSSAPGGIPTHALLTVEFPQFCRINSYPGILSASLAQQADSIAKGVSRFSFFPPDILYNSERKDLLGGLVRFQTSYLHPPNVPSSGPRPIPLKNLNVQCQDPENPSPLPEFLTSNDTSAIFGDNATGLFPVGKNAVQQLLSSYYNEQTELVTDERIDVLYQPICDFENPVAEDKQDDQSIWTVLDWTAFDPGFEFPGIGTDFESFGWRDANGDLRWYMDFSLEDTELSCYRKNGWQNGRATRDGIVLAIGMIPMTMQHIGTGLNHTTITPAEASSSK